MKNPARCLLGIILVTAAAGAHMVAAPQAGPVPVYVHHPKLVTDESKQADFVEKYLRKWAKTEIVFVDTPEAAIVTVEILPHDTQVGALAAYMATAKVCKTKPDQACTELTDKSQDLPSKIKKFVTDNTKGER